MKLPKGQPLPHANFNSKHHRAKAQGSLDLSIDDLRKLRDLAQRDGDPRPSIKVARAIDKARGLA